jgi:hypothetical protein
MQRAASVIAAVDGLLQTQYRYRFVERLRARLGKFQVILGQV